MLEPVFFFFFEWCFMKEIATLNFTEAVLGVMGLDEYAKIYGGSGFSKF